MIDPIQAAVAKANGATTNAISDAQTKVSALRENLPAIPSLPALPALPATAATAVTAVSQLRNMVPQLPTVKDPELLKKQAEAQAQALLADQKQKLLETKDNAVNQLNAARGKASAIINAAAGLSIQALGAAALSSISSGKLPKLKQLSDPKLLAALNVAKKIKELAKERKKISQENLEKGKEMFKYPIKAVVPELPKPTIPSVPKIPKLPVVPNALPLPRTSPIPIPPIPKPAPTPTSTRVPPGISAADWKRFGISFLDDATDVKNAYQRKEFRRQEIIKIQEERVRKAKEFVDRQAQRLAADPSLQSSYNTAVRVYNERVAYLQKVKSDTSIVDLTE